MSETSPMTPNPKVVHTQLGEGQAVLLHLETHKYYSLNRTGRLVWDLLSQGKGLEEIKAHFVEEFGISPEQAGSDIQRVISQLTDAGLISQKKTG